LVHDRSAVSSAGARPHSCSPILPERWLKGEKSKANQGRESSPPGSSSRNSMSLAGSDDDNSKKRMSHYKGMIRHAESERSRYVRQYHLHGLLSFSLAGLLDKALLSLGPS